MKTFFANTTIVFLTAALLFLLFDKVIMPLYVSQNPETVVPDLTGQDFDTAKQLLEDKDFRVEKKESYDNTRKKNTVMSQSPEPGMIVKGGRIVYLTVSNNQQLTKVPDLIGKTERNAEILIQSANLKIGTVTKEKTDDYPEGTVFKQSLSPSTKVVKDSKMNFSVSAGRSEYIVPNLKGKTLSSGKALIRSAGLKVGNVTYRFNADLLPETVLDQQPGANSVVAPQTEVNIIVSTLDESQETNDQG